MLQAPTQNRFEWNFNNAAAVTTTPGTSVVPGASNAEGEWTQIASAADIANDVYLIKLNINSGATAAQVKHHLLDIGVDPAGGTAYVAVVSDMICGSSYMITNGRQARYFQFPLYIPAGSTVAARIQGNNATAGTVNVAAQFFGKPTRPEMFRVGSYSETVGAIGAASAGVAFTPGNATEGAWTELGTTVKDLWWWQVCCQINNTVLAGNPMNVDLAYGDATNKHEILTDVFHLYSTTEEIGNELQINAYKEVPAGSLIYIRARATSAPVTGHNGNAIGIGG